MGSGALARPTASGRRGEHDRQESFARRRKGRERSICSANALSLFESFRLLLVFVLFWFFAELPADPLLHCGRDGGLNFIKLVNLLASEFGKLDPMRRMSAKLEGLVESG